MTCGEDTSSKGGLNLSHDHILEVACPHRPRMPRVMLIGISRDTLYCTYTGSLAYPWFVLWPPAKSVPNCRCVSGPEKMAHRVGMWRTYAAVVIQRIFFFLLGDNWGFLLVCFTISLVTCDRESKSTIPRETRASYRMNDRSVLFLNLEYITWWFHDMPTETNHWGLISCLIEWLLPVFLPAFLNVLWEYMCFSRSPGYERLICLVTKQLSRA